MFMNYRVFYVCIMLCKFCIVCVRCVSSTICSVSLFLRLRVLWLCVFCVSIISFHNYCLFPSHHVHVHQERGVFTRAAVSASVYSHVRVSALLWEIKRLPFSRRGCKFTLLTWFKHGSSLHLKAARFCPLNGQKVLINSLELQFGQ